mgnify:CR=1 FL=1
MEKVIYNNIITRKLLDLINLFEIGCCIDDDTLTYLKKFKNLRELIKRIGMAKNEHNNRFDHQCRLKDEEMEIATKLLLNNIAKIEQKKDFHSLFLFLEEILKHVKGIGEMYIYDTCERIGIYLGYRPKYVYLHRGVRQGARNMGLDVKGKKYLIVDALGDPFTNLEPYEIEDFLCQKKNELKKIFMYR